MPQRPLLAGLASLVLFSVIAPAAADDRPLSAAQIALFESNHLRAIDAPAKLDYVFRHEEKGAAPVVDSIELDIREVREDGRKNVWVAFLTGERRVGYPPAIGFNGNPLLMYALERDVNEMRRMTGGAATYFRNRIRAAFADAAEVRRITVPVGDRQAEATAIAIAPFRDDPRIDRFPAFRDKAYEFVLSDAVPGTIYQIRTLVPGADGAPAVEETITFAGERR